MDLELTSPAYLKCTLCKICIKSVTNCFRSGWHGGWRSVMNKVTRSKSLSTRQHLIVFLWRHLNQQRARSLRSCAEEGNVSLSSLRYRWAASNQYFVPFWESRLDANTLSTQLRVAERRCLLQREEVAGGKCAEFNCAAPAVWPLRRGIR